MTMTVILYAVLMPFLSALAPAAWLPLPLALMILATPGLVLARRLRALIACWKRDIWFGLIFALGVFAIVGSPVPVGAKALNYTFAVLVSYLFFFVMARELLNGVSGSWDTISRAAHASLTILSIGVVIEFYLASWHGIFFTDLLPFAHDDLEIAFLLNEDFRRPRAFSAEPGFTAVAYECLWPLTWLGGAVVRRRMSWRVSQGLYAAAFMLLSSAAAIGCLAAASLVVWLVRSRDIKRFLRLVVPLAAVVSTMLLAGWGEDLLWGVFGRKLGLFGAFEIDGADAVTALVRLGRYGTGLDLLTEYPFGVGWGGVAQAFNDNMSIPGAEYIDGSGLINLYLDLAVAAGVVSVPIMLVFFGIRWHGTLRSPHPAAAMVATALISVCLHHLFITEFQMPFLWFVLALADCLWLQERRERRPAKLMGSRPSAPVLKVGLQA